ncbi:hypothetical protein BH20GEM1_BH20GEM1_18080 [soil metagenome]
METGAISRANPFLAVLLGIAACEGGLFAPESSAPPIRTSADEYLLETTTIGWQTEIPFVYANPSDGPYYLPNCGGSYFYVLEKLVEGRWVVGWGPILPLCRSPVIRIDAGATLADTVGVFGGFPGSNFSPKFLMADPQGIYRIVVDALGSYDEDARPVGPLLRREQRVSNEFRLVTADAPTD